MSSSKRIYFSGLNGIRFFAASAVVFHHCEQYKSWEGLPNLWGAEGWIGTFVDALGHKAVSLFFVLSGFLITYLLLAEIARSGTVNLKKFYVRRALRIWPVYYLVLVIAFFILPQFISLGNWNEILDKYFTISLVISLVILPNFLRATPVQVAGANQAWSVGVEEQFYLIWPILVRRFYKVFVPFLLILLGVKFGIHFLAYFGSNYFHGSTLGTAFNKFYTLWYLFRIEQMAVGALGAYYLYHQKENILKLIYSKYTQVICLVVFVSFFFFNYNELHSGSLIEAVIFLIFIMNVSTNDSFFLKLKSKRYDTLGNISYGIYMYHTICISLVMYVLENMGMTESIIAYNVILYSVAYIMTLLLSYLSYTYFELYFLKFKEKFMVVKSGMKTQAN